MPWARPFDDPITTPNGQRNRQMTAKATTAGAADAKHGGARAALNVQHALGHDYDLTTD